MTPNDEIGTDRKRLDSFSYEFAANMNLLYAGYPWRFTRFRKTNGYANMPLDGVWLRAPYLHNGSMPTLRDLLEPPEAGRRRFTAAMTSTTAGKPGSFPASPRKKESGTSFMTPACRVTAMADISTEHSFRPPIKTRLSST